MAKLTKRATKHDEEKKPVTTFGQDFGPIHKQLKKELSGAVIFFQMSDGYDLYYGDALALSPLMGVKLRENMYLDEVPAITLTRAGLTRAVDLLLSQARKVAIMPIRGEGVRDKDGHNVEVRP